MNLLSTRGRGAKRGDGEGKHRCQDSGGFIDTAQTENRLSFLLWTALSMHTFKSVSQHAYLCASTGCCSGAHSPRLY